MSEELTPQAKQNFREAIDDLEKGIPQGEKELKESIESKEFISNFQFDDKDIKFKNKIVGILDFYINDLKENTEFCKSQKKNYEDIIKRGYF